LLFWNSLDFALKNTGQKLSFVNQQILSEERGLRKNALAFKQYRLNFVSFF